MSPRLTVFALLAGALAGSVPVHAGDGLEVRLLEGKPCGACQLYGSLNGGYPEQVVDRIGGGTIPVTVARKTDLPDTLATQFVPHRYWDQSLSVMVLRGDEVLYVGNIAEASDLTNARYPEAIMAPRTAQVHERAANPIPYLHEHFKATWKLEYFVDVALGRRRPHVALDRSLLDSTATMAVARDNVILWGSAGTPGSNPLYIAERMREIRTTLLRPLPQVNVVTLYGNGSDPRPDTSALVEDAPAYVQSGLDSPWSPDGPTLGRLFHSLQGSRHNLLVQVGHSGPTGAPLWGQPATIDAPLLQSLVASTGSDTVMVSGACNSGQFANTPSCGFFAAHPNVVATGCQKSAEALRGSDDYLRLYFRGLDDGSADLDDDGEVSFSEAHWHAAVALEEHQIPYDSADALVDAYWEANARALPGDIRYGRLVELAQSHGTPEERWAVGEFKRRVRPDTAITLTGALELNDVAMRRLEGMTESPSAERNAAMALAYPLVLSSLARRLVWRSKASGTPSSARLAQCGRRGILSFLGGR